VNPMEYLRIAFGALASNKIRAFLTMLGVIIGVASVIMLVAIGEGAKQYIRDQLMGMGSNMLIITPGKTETRGGGPPMMSGVHKLTMGDALALEKRATALAYVCPVVAGTAPIKYGIRERNVQVAGVAETMADVYTWKVDVGSFFSKTDIEARRRVVVIGRTIQKELFGQENPLGKMVKIGQTKFRVIGMMARKGSMLGQDVDDHIFIPVTTGMDLFDQDGLIEIITKVVNENMVEQAKEQIKAALMPRHGNEEDFTIITQAGMLDTVQAILGTFTYVLGGIASISLLVGGIGIMNIMLVSVSERTREIGLRKAIGAAQRDIRIQFLIESVTLSMLGGIIGILFGSGVAVTTHMALPAMPVSISLWSVVTAFSFAVAVGVFFGIYPAMKAARLNPIEALRHE